MGWNLNELRNLLKNKNLPDSYIYQKTLYWKEARASYHADRAKKIWDKLWNSKEKINIFGIEWEKRQLAIEAEVEACAQILNSLPDVLSQLINISIFQGLKKNISMKENDVTIWKVRDKLHKLPNNPNKIKNELVNFLDSDEFKYIRAFVSTIKHIRLLDTESFITATPRDLQSGIKFNGFTYRSKKFLEHDYSYITEDCKKSFFNFLDKIGFEINSYLK